MSLFDHLVKVEAFNSSQEDFAKLTQLAQEDKHDIFVPTDVIWKNGQPVGCFLVQMVPMLSGYFSTKNMFARDSAMAVNTMEQIVKRTTGANKVTFPINHNSPFLEKMETLGYVKEANHTYFYKKL